ncbi:hypothetical protein M3Y99_00295600 [Aphelenchoides fujianensis]|nr:hypothetical protein M3Y99_00295600 [Aphelenchoides fujianensis]
MVFPIFDFDGVLGLAWTNATDSPPPLIGILCSIPHLPASYSVVWLEKPTSADSKPTASITFGYPNDHCDSEFHALDLIFVPTSANSFPAVAIDAFAFADYSYPKGGTATKQLAFLSNQVFTDEWTNLERLVFVPYNQRAFEQTFTADNTAADVRQQLAELKQSRPSNLSTLFAVLDSWQQQPAESPVHLLVFVSRIDQAAVDASRPFVRSLQQKNYALTFVAVGGQLDAALFFELSSNLIRWDVERQNVPAGWYAAFWTAYGCSEERDKWNDDR